MLLAKSPMMGWSRLAPCEPAHVVDLVPVGRQSRVGRQACAVDDADVGALVAVGVGEPELGTSDGADQPGDLDIGADLFTSLAARRVLGCLVLVHRATDGAVGPEVRLADQENTPVVIKGQDRYRREQEQVVPYFGA